jgi:hypothetical protein
MLAKLLKYDFRSMFKSFLPIWLAVLAIALVNHFTLNYDGQLTSRLGSISVILPILIYVGIIIAMIVLTLMFMIQRFYNGLLRDEGYLMFTLPVRPWQLIASKNIASTVTVTLSGLIGVGSVLLLMQSGTAAKLIKALFEIFGRSVEFTPTQTGLMLFELCIIMLIGIAGSIYRVYAAIALGHLFRNHRVGWAFAMYIVINVVLSVLVSALSKLYSLMDAAGALDSIRLAYAGWSSLTVVQMWLLMLFLVSVLQVVVFHIITERILSKRLNLE